ncbi:uncharacterized protein LOC122528236 [Frieseomelitta varia]|uniref:uncharacterized protein LOC122528236 n=1 Tax=Frieseomelitta varia TaxID=561572 RepID=UPI001CB6859A|nr:uncharacterized protein LOC122528236 [Frieseomelitta varia]
MITFRKVPYAKITAGLSAFIGCGILTTEIYMHYYMQQKIRETVTYKKALSIFYNHEDAIKYLGKPIKEGKITLPVNKTNNIKTFNVNVKGANTKGKLHLEYQVHPDHQTEIKKVEIKFNDTPDKTLLIHEI